MIPDVHVAVSLPAFVLVLAFVVAAALSWLSYRVTLPPVPVHRRRTLMGLRTASLLIVFILLGEPIISLVTHSNEKPLIAVLIDNSRSLTIRDGGVPRSATLIRTLESAEVRSLSETGEVQYNLFSADARRIAGYSRDSLSLNGDATDIDASLKSVVRANAASNLRAIVLITDGVSTTGPNPVYAAEESGVPIFAVGIGDTTEQKDVSVQNVLTNEIAYVGTRVPVRATIRSSGYNDAQVRVTLRQGNSILDRQTLRLRPGLQEYSVPLSFVPGQEGRQQFSVETSPLEGELTDQNNRYPFTVKVLRSKMRVVLIAGAPSPDVTFLRRTFAGDSTFDLKMYIGRQPTGYYEGMPTAGTLKDADCISLVEFPTATTPDQTLSLVVEAARSGKPIFYVGGRRIDEEKFRSLEPLLPFTVDRFSPIELETFLSIPPRQQENQILKLAGISNPADVWSKLPPFFRTQTVARAKPESEILAFSRIQSTTLNEPMLMERTVNQSKSVAFVGYGIWRWTMLSDPGSAGAGVLRQFVYNVVRWLTSREEGRRFRIKPGRETFSSQEPVTFLAQVYDESYEPTDDAQITVVVHHEGQSSELMLSPLGNGQYDGSLGELDAGEYTYEANFVVNGSSLGHEQGSFFVGGVNAEFIETRMNREGLLRLADRTGGRYYDPADIRSIAHDIAALKAFKPRAVTRSTELEIWNSRWLLGIVVVLFSLEWFIRKRSGML